MNGQERSRLAEGDPVVFIDRKERQYLRVLRAGSRLQVRDGTMRADRIIGMEEGSRVYNSAGEPFLVLRPTFASLIPNLPRQAQVIYPKDLGPILLWGDIYPGARVVEVGVGPGATTLALLRAIGREGELVSYEARQDFFELAQANVHRFHGEARNWTLKLRDARDGIDEVGVDRMLIDIAEPWVLFEQARRVLRPGGVLIAYVPTALQLKQVVDAAQDHGFGAVQSMETLVRFWHVRGLSVRPEHRMVAHTGFITCARRLSDRGEPVPAAEP